MSLLLFFTVQLSFGQIPLDGLVGYYMLDGNAIDSSGMDNHGIILGQVTPTTNRFGEIDKACSFDGGYIDAGNPMDFQIIDSISIAAWILKPIQQDNWSGVVSKWSQNDGGYYLGINPTNNIIRWNIAGLESINGSSPIVDEWTHVVATFSGDSIYLYENSILSSSTANVTPIGNTILSLVIGSQSNLPTSVFNGSIDDVLIYNRELNQAEIESIYNPVLSDTKDLYSDSSVMLSPNPTSGLVKIENNSEHEIASYTLYNASGKKIKAASFKEEIDISDQIAGIYYIILNFEDGSITKKIVKQ